MFDLKLLLATGIGVAVCSTALLLHKLHELLKAIQELHADISVIRLDNSRTMAELRRRHR